MARETCTEDPMRAYVLGGMMEQLEIVQKSGIVLISKAWIQELVEVGSGRVMYGRYALEFGSGLITKHWLYL